MDYSGTDGSAPSREIHIPRSSLLSVANGVVAATKIALQQALSLYDWIDSNSRPSNREQSTLAGPSTETVKAELTYRQWRNDIDGYIWPNGQIRQLMLMSLALTVIHESCTQNHADRISTSDLTALWRTIIGTFTGTTLDLSQLTASRNNQDFLTIDLCSTIDDSEVAFQLLAWLPDEHYRKKDPAVRSHPIAFRYWILAGEVSHRTYTAQSTEPSSPSSHEITATPILRNPGLVKMSEASGTKSQAINNTDLVEVRLVGSQTYTCNMTWTIPAGVFHHLVIPTDGICAMLAMRDPSLSTRCETLMLAPKNEPPIMRIGGATTATTLKIASIVSTIDAVRRYELCLSEGQRHIQHAEVEDALGSFNSALSICSTFPDFPQAMRCRHRVLAELGRTNRNFGRYEQASDILEFALAESRDDLQRVDIYGELGVVYRQMGRFADAKSALEAQYEKAEALKLDHAACRAIGNLGMINYQLSQQKGDDVLLEVAIQQLGQRIQSARNIRVVLSSLSSGQADQADQTRLLKSIILQEAIGHARLSLCYTVRGDRTKAIEAGQASLDLAHVLDDTNGIALSRFFYGRALLRDGQMEAAIAQFNGNEKCTPAIALCKEPSDEHREYLQELVKAGVDIDAHDKQGYTALDYAVFNGDEKSQTILLSGLDRQLSGDAEAGIAQRLTEARLRKGYRELFQEKLRPALLKENNGLHELRRTYSQTLYTDQEKGRMFDHLRVLPYSEFLKFGRIPRSSDGVARELLDGSQRAEEGCGTEMVIFFSYTRLKRATRGLESSPPPDDEKNSLYARMIAAAEEFLELHSHVSRDKLKIWVDYACIDQDDLAAGVAALPMLIAQCDAAISLVNDRYYERAWCSVEVLMMQTLRKAYKTHLWYEQVPIEVDASTRLSNQDECKLWTLRQGSIDFKIVMAEKQLSFEEDRPKVLFLERQSKLLG